MFVGKPRWRKAARGRLRPRTREGEQQHSKNWRNNGKQFVVGRPTGPEVSELTKTFYCKGDIGREGEATELQVFRHLAGPG
jgi:hypothetical protein